MKEQNSLWEPRVIKMIRYEVWPRSSDHLKLEEAAVSFENLYHINSIKRRSKTKQKRVSCVLVIFFLRLIENGVYSSKFENWIGWVGANYMRGWQEVIAQQGSTVIRINRALVLRKLQLLGVLSWNVRNLFRSQTLCKFKGLVPMKEIAPHLKWTKNKWMNKWNKNKINKNRIIKVNATKNWTTVEPRKWQASI